jgi:hypothetical protein
VFTLHQYFTPIELIVVGVCLYVPFDDEAFHPIVAQEPEALVLNVTFMLCPREEATVIDNLGFVVE